MRPISRLLVSTDVGDLGPEVRRLFEDLARRRPERRQMVSGECVPLQDVFETEHTIEIVLDVPGVTADSCRVLIKGGIVLVVGEKERHDVTRLPLRSLDGRNPRQDESRFSVKATARPEAGQGNIEEASELGPRQLASFHLVERDFGRFARAVRVHAAIDATKARARLKDGELRIALPKLAERRGREIPVPIETGSPTP